MKKITLLAAVIVVASFASCKKKRTCKCDTISVESEVKMTKKDAKAWCEGSTGGACTLQN